MSGPEQQPHAMRHDEPDEPDEAGHRHRRAGQERGRRHDQPLRRLDVDAERRGSLLSEQQQVERPRLHAAPRTARPARRALRSTRGPTCASRARPSSRTRSPGRPASVTMLTEMSRLDARGQKRTDGDAGQQQRRDRRRSATCRDGVDHDQAPRMRRHDRRERKRRRRRRRPSPSRTQPPRRARRRDRRPSGSARPAGCETGSASSRPRSRARRPRRRPRARAEAGSARRSPRRHV